MISEQLRKATDDEIRKGLTFATLPGTAATLRGLLYFLTGDEGLEKIKVEKGPGFVTSNAAYVNDPQDLAILKDKAFQLLKSYRDGKAEPPVAERVAPKRMMRAIQLATGFPVPESEYDFWYEELAFDPLARRLKWDDKPVDKLTNFKVIVVGAGLNGINAAIQLKLAGFSFVVFEKNAGVGGTWHQNHYPGARVDLPSQMYSHLFAVDYPFKHTFAPQPENETYANWCVDNFKVRDKIRFQTEVLSMRWDEDASIWHVKVRTSDGTVEDHQANAIISAVGLFDRPGDPDFPGLEKFKGKWMHTAKYDNALDMSKSRVAVIGTGATGLQLTADLAPTVKHLTVFQRSAGWILPFPGYRDPMAPEAAWYRQNMPYASNFGRMAFTFLTGDHDMWSAYGVDPEWKDPHTLNQDNYNLRQVCVKYLEEKLGHRPDLVQKALPDYPPLSKRFILDNGFYDTILRDNVDLVTDSIDHFVEDGIVTKSGRKVEFDVVIFATGFRANDYFWPIEITGRNGVNLGEVWKKDGARAYWGVAIPTLPNFICLYGPNTNGKIAGPLPWGEMQTRFALTCFKRMIENGWRSMEVKKEAYNAFNAELDRELSTSIWMDKRQNSYYRNEFGRSATNSPWKASQLYEAWKEPKMDHWTVT